MIPLLDLKKSLRSPDGQPVLFASSAAGDDPENRSLLIFITIWIVK